MNTFRFGRPVLGVFVAIGMLAGCSGGTTASVPQGVASAFFRDATRVQPLSAAYKVLYRFKGYPSDGESPFSGLTAMKGTLYGTTLYGGNAEYGTVFAVNPFGNEEVLHNFKDKTDGAYPYAGLVAMAGELYGTTSIGGSSQCSYSRGIGCGTVFAISTGGVLRVLYKFNGFPTDGTDPQAGLLVLNNALYGTTLYGGDFKCESDSGGCGSVFEVSASGSERVLHRFRGYPHDGAYPSGPLIAENGMLYGTTTAGGNGSACTTGCGTVFEIASSGAGYKTIYSFGGGTDGANPEGALLFSKGILYGTTEMGGATNNGTVFGVSASGKEGGVLYSFNGTTDGALPTAGLLSHKGLFFGTTSEGGAECPPSGRCGTVFQVSKSGTEHVLYSFKGKKDGAYPVAPLFALHGALYGTTSGGIGCGSGCLENGTIFRLAP